MITYYSTFITGFQEVIKSSLKERLKDIQIDLVLDGLIVYKTNESVEKVLSLGFLNNTFFLLQFFDKKRCRLLEIWSKSFYIKEVQ